MKQNAFSPKLARYLAAQFLIPLVCCLLGFSILFLIIDLFDVLQDFIDHKATFGEATQYFMLQQPQRIVVVIPMALMLSAMYTFSNLSKHNEITAIKASGISIIRCCRYIWLIGGLGVLFLLWFLEFIVPGSSIKAEALEDSITNPKVKEMKSQILAYRSVDSKRNWIFGSFEVLGKKSQVVLKQFRPDDTIKWELRADSAVYDDNSGWTFSDCQVTEFDHSGSPTQASETVDSLTNHLFRERFGDVLDETPDSIHGSLSPREETSSRDLYKFLSNSKTLAESTRNKSLSIIYYRLFFPFSCMIALLISLPLSISSGRGGIFVNIFAAIMLMAGYYLFINGFRIIGQQGFIPPFLALLIPTVVSLSAGCVLMYKKR